jgi:hypothetical protein
LKFAPQARSLGHVRHVNNPPHPSGGLPQCAPTASQVVGTQSHRLGSTAPHVVGAGQTPQESVPEQPSLMLPHSAPSAAQVLGIQEPGPHRPGPAPPQTVPVGHPGQVSVLPQPS